MRCSSMLWGNSLSLQSRISRPSNTPTPRWSRSVRIPLNDWRTRIMPSRAGQIGCIGTAEEYRVCECGVGFTKHPPVLPMVKY